MPESRIKDRMRSWNQREYAIRCSCRTIVSPLSEKGESRRRDGKTTSSMEPLQPVCAGEIENVKRLATAATNVTQPLKTAPFPHGLNSRGIGHPRGRPSASRASPSWSSGATMTTVSPCFEPHNRGELGHPSVVSVLYGLFAGKLVWRLRQKAI